MIDILAQLAHGFVHCLTPLNMAMLVTGIVIGLLIGVLPGLTLVMGVALALPFTYKMDVTASIVLLTAMYVSGTYGGAFTAILFRIPGEPIDVPMLWDGYTMGRLDAGRRARRRSSVGGRHGGAHRAAREICTAVFFARIFRDRDVRPAQRGRHRQGLALQRLHQHERGHSYLDGRHRPDLRRLSLHLRLADFG
jgi:TctA family transporter